MNSQATKAEEGTEGVQTILFQKRHCYIGTAVKLCQITGPIPWRLRVRTKRPSGMTVPQCEVAGHEGSERDAAPNRRKELEERRPRLTPEGTPIGRSLCSGGSPARPASPSLGSGPAQTGGRRKSRFAPIRTGPHRPAPGRLTQLATEHSPRTLPIASASLAQRLPTRWRQRLLRLFCAYLLSGRHFRRRTHPPLGLASLPRRRGRSEGGDASVVRLRQASRSGWLSSSATWLLSWKSVSGFGKPACLAE